MSVAKQYYDNLKDITSISIPKINSDGKHSFQSCCIYVENRDDLMKGLAEKGIQTQIGTYALHMLKAFKENPDCQIARDMTGSKYAFEHCLTLPMYHDMTREEQDYVIDELGNYVRNLRDI